MASAREIYALDPDTTSVSGCGVIDLTRSEARADRSDKQTALYEDAYQGSERRGTQDKACNACHGTKDIYGDPAQVYSSMYSQPYYGGFQQYGNGNYMHNPAYRGYAQQFNDGAYQCNQGYNQPYAYMNQSYYGGFNQPYAYMNQGYCGGFNQPYAYMNQGYYGGFNQPYAYMNQGYYGGFNQPYANFNQGCYGGYGGGNHMRNEIGAILGSLPYMLNGGYGYGRYGGYGGYGGGLSGLLYSLPFLIGRHHHSHHRFGC